MDVATVLRRLPSRTTIIPPIRRSRRSRTTCRPTREATVEKPAGCNLVMGQVTKILKRGEELPESLKQKKELIIKKEKNCVSDKTGWMSFFSGSFWSFDSPTPSSLPMPSFLTKKKRVACLSEDEEEALDLELLKLGFFAV